MVQSAPTPRLEAVSGPAADQRRRAILGAASRLFRQRGLHATGMREIAAELGMTAGNLYYYFSSKQELLAYCQEQTLGQLLERARAIRRLPLDAGEKLRRLIEGHVAVLNEETPGSLAHLEVNEVPPARRVALLARRRSYETAIRELIEEGRAAGEFREIDSRLATLALLGALNWTVKWFSPDGRKSAAEVGREFADLLLGGLLRHGAASQRRSIEAKDIRSGRLAERQRAGDGEPSRETPAGGGSATATAAQHLHPASHRPLNGRLLGAEIAAGASAKRPGARRPGASRGKVSAFREKRK